MRKYNLSGATFYPNILKYTQIHHKIVFIVLVKERFYIRGGSRGAHAPPKIGKNMILGVKSWFFTWNTQKKIPVSLCSAPPPPLLTWNPGSTPVYELFFIKKCKFHKFVTRVIKMINFITILNIDTPTWSLPTNTNVPKHTQNSYGMCYLHTTNIFFPTLF
jgi:hypothetical protein